LFGYWIYIERKGLIDIYNRKGDGGNNMVERIDARGLSCPVPIFKTQEKIWEMKEGVIEVLVDDATAKQNVARTAKKEGWDVEIKDLGDDECLLTLSK
jgi:TusA-related sulfurtransferase